MLMAHARDAAQASAIVQPPSNREPLRLERLASLASPSRSRLSRLVHPVLGSHLGELEAEARRVPRLEADQLHHRAEARLARGEG